MSQYDRFALHYDRAMGDREETARLVRRLVRARTPRARTLLELGCGTGSLLVPLARHYDVTGVDLSSAMLSVARQKLPDTPLYRQDISKLDLGARYDIIICMFDTMNHLVSFASWQRVFERARRHLAKDGVFIFDINTERKLERYAAEQPYAEVEKKHVLVMDVTNTAPSRYRLDIRLFLRESGETYRLASTSVPELAVPTHKVLAAVKKHFRKVELFDAERPRASAASEELYFICSRPR